jgi:hypothetical protein
MRQSKFICVIAALAVVLAGTWLVVSQRITSATDEPDVIQADTRGVLDGMAFSGEIGPLNKPADVKDDWIFDNGMFVSTECERKCNYPARPYYVRQVGGAIEFLSETHCPGKDAKIVWRGIIDGETIKGKFTWTVVRWYWTIEKQFWFEGTLSDSGEPLVSGS